MNGGSSSIFKRASWPLLTTLIVGLGIIAGSYLFTNATLTSMLKREFLLRAQPRAMAIINFLHRYVTANDTAQPYYEAGQGLTAETFESYARARMQSYPGISWMGWTGPVSHPRVRRARAHSVAQHDSGLPTRLRLAAVAKRGALKGHLLRFNLGAMPAWRHAMARAAAIGQPTTALVTRSAPVIGAPSSMLVFTPVYRTGAAHRAIAGFVVSMVDVGYVTEQGLRDITPVAGGVTLAVRAALGGAPSSEVYLHGSRTLVGHKGGVSNTYYQLLQERDRAKIGGGSWDIVSTVVPGFFNTIDVWFPLKAAAAAFILTLVALIYIVMNARHAATIEAEEAAKLADAQKKAAENDVLNDSIIGLLRSVARLGNGDLTVKVPVNEDVTGALGDAINAMAESTARILGNVVGVSQEVRSASQEGRITASESTQGMIEIRGSIQETGKRIKRLGERSQEIGGIVKLIDDIAERTSVLALNANMQAAVAGEAGRGFRVVADEVQRLAERSKEATNQIAKLVDAIQTETNDTVAAMDRAIGEVVKGGELATKAAEHVTHLDALGSALLDSVQAFKLPDEVLDANRTAAGGKRRAA